MKYAQLMQTNDPDVPLLHSIYCNPSVTKYVSVDKGNFWKYVTQTPGVCFYKAYQDSKMVGTVHCETCDDVLSLAIVVFPEYQRSGIGTEILSDILSDKLSLGWKMISVSIVETNIPSIKLFEKMGFVCAGREEGLLEYTYTK